MASSAITLSVVATGSASVTAVSASLRERFGWARFEPLRRNVDWVAYELANPMWELCKSGDPVLKGDAARDFVRTYRDGLG